MTWQSVGTHTFVPTDKAVQVGSFDLAAGQDTIWVKITQLNNPGDWPWSYGILSWRNSEGVPLGSVKAYSNRLGEVFRLGNGLAPLVGTGGIWFEPRGFNLGWLKAGFPWELSFEAQAGSTGVSTSYWNRDPVNGVLSPVTAGDSVDLGSGNLTGGDAAFAGQATFVNSAVKIRSVGDLLFPFGDVTFNGPVENPTNMLIAAKSGLPLVCRAGNTGGVELDPGATDWHAVSDIRRKTDLVPISDGLNKVATLRCVTGRYLDDPPNRSRSFLIAQDVQRVLPEAVADRDPDNLGLYYSSVIPLLVSALHDAKKRIEALEARR